MKKKMLWMLAMLLLLVSAGCSDDSKSDSDNGQKGGETVQVADDFESRADWLATAYKKTKPMIASVWNATVNPDDFVMLFVSEDMKTIYLIDDNGKQKVPKADWPEAFLNDPDELVRGSFLIVKYKGRNSCMILDCRNASMQKMQSFSLAFNPSEYACDLLELFYHESFHAYVQDGKNKWVVPPIGSGDELSRGQVFPIIHEPRIYRKLMVQSLINALNNKGSKTENYSRAKYWLNKFNTDFPKEVARVKETDIHEGTAEYFGRAIVKSVYSDYPLMQPFEGPNLAAPLSTESYMLSIAINLAVSDGRKDEVISCFEKGERSPIDVLLKDVDVPTGYDEKADKADWDRIMVVINKMYGPDSPILKPLYDILAAHRSGSNTYLVTKSRESGMVQGMGSYMLTDEDVAGYSCEVAATVLLVNVALEGCTIMWYVSSDANLVPVDAKSIQITNEMQIDSHLSELIPGATITSEATLTSFTLSETVEVRNLPINVEIGSDKFGNKLIFLKNDK